VLFKIIVLGVQTVPQHEQYYYIRNQPQNV